MKQTFHILNGDALLECFPKEIEGKSMVFRECLVDGDVTGDSLQDFFRVRAKFLSQAYGGISKGEYYQQTVSEFQKIEAIPEKAVINLWFEDDLFCQVNFWFLVNHLHQLNCSYKLFLVRPPKLDHLGFGGLNQKGLWLAFKNRIHIQEPERIAALWTAYKYHKTDDLLGIAGSLQQELPFVYNAVKAHLQRIPSSQYPGKPVLSIMQIMDDLNTDEFGPVFREFSRRESVYGFGDLQVQRLLNQIREK